MDRVDPRSTIARRVLATLLLAAAAGAQAGETPLFVDGFEDLTISTVEIAPAALLLTSSGATGRLTAIVRDGNGAIVPATVTWSSDEPAVVGVDADGDVTAGAPRGTVRVTARVGGVEADPAYVYVATPVAGAILLDDDDIVSGPVAVDAEAEPSPDAPIEVVLRGVPAMPIGSILVNTGARSVGGEVVAVEAQGDDLRVRLVVGPPQSLFTDFAFDDEVDVATLDFATPEDIDAAYAVSQSGDTFTYTPDSAPGTAAKGGATGTRAQPLPPFQDCEASAGFGSGLPVPLSLSTQPAFSVQVNGTLAQQATPQGRTVTITAKPVVTLATELSVTSAFEAKFACKATLHRRKVRVPGWAGLFFGGDIEFGAGFEVGGKVTLASAKVGGSATLDLAVEAGLTCGSGGADCAITGNADATTALTPVFEAPSLDQARFEPAVKLFGFVAGELGNADIEQLQFKAIEATAGARLGASYTLESVQIANPDASTGRSKYELAVEGEVGPGIKLGEFLEYLGLAEFVPLKLGFSVPLGSSPEVAFVTADRESYNPGDPATVRVGLSPTSTALFPAATFYNVASVSIVRRTGATTTETLATEVAALDDTEFTLSFVSPALLAADELHAFVTPKFLGFAPLPRLELGPATGASTLAAAGGTFRNAAAGTIGTAVYVRLRNPDGTPVSAPVSLTVQGPPGWNGGNALALTYPVGFLRQFYALAAAPVTGAYQVSGTVDGALVSDSFSVDAARILDAPGPVVVDPSVANVVSGSWNAVPGAASYLARVFDVPAARILAPVRFTADASASLDGVAIVDAGTKAFQVFAFSHDLRPPDPPVPAAFDLSFDRTFLQASVTVSPANSTLQPGTVQGLSASVVGLASPDVTWTGTGGSLVASGTTAQWTAPSAPGTYTITAASVSNPSFRGRARLTVPGAGTCNLAAIAQRFAGDWVISGTPIATGGSQNCSTVPEFAGFLNGGVLRISGTGTNGFVEIVTPAGIRPYPGRFTCSENFTDDVIDITLGFFEGDPDELVGQLNLYLARSSRVLPCTALIGGAR